LELYCKGIRKRVVYANNINKLAYVEKTH